MQLRYRPNRGMWHMLLPHKKNQNVIFVDFKQMRTYLDLGFHFWLKSTGRGENLSITMPLFDMRVAGSSSVAQSKQRRLFKEQ